MRAQLRTPRLSRTLMTPHQSKGHRTNTMISFQRPHSFFSLTSRCFDFLALLSYTSSTYKQLPLISSVSYDPMQKTLILFDDLGGLVITNVLYWLTFSLDQQSTQSTVILKDNNPSFSLIMHVICIPFSLYEFIHIYLLESRSAIYKNCTDRYCSLTIYIYMCIYTYFHYNKYI